MSELAAWDSFYVIVGSAAGALIGLQFVVMTLIAERPRVRAAEAGAVLLLAALLRAPWPAISIALALWGLLVVGGVAYAIIVARRTRKQPVYEPDYEDWAFLCGLPVAAYATLALSAVVALSYTQKA